MASIPCTLVIYSEDTVNLPIETLYVVLKQLFQFGVKDITIKRDKIFLSLSYTPKLFTLQKMFGNLPVKYMKMKLENEEEFEVLERVIKKFKFNVDNEEEEEVEDVKKIESIPSESTSLSSS